MYSLFRHCLQQRSLMLQSSSTRSTFAQMPLQCLAIYELTRTHSYFSYLPTSRESVVFTTESAAQNGRSDSNNGSNEVTNKNSKSSSSRKNEAEEQKVHQKSLLFNWVEKTFVKDDKESLPCLAKTCRRFQKKIVQMRKTSHLQSDSLDIDELLKTNKLEDPKALTYPLHTMNKISDVITRSIIARRNTLFVECYLRSRANMIPRQSLEDTCNNIAPHNALYFRIVDTSEFVQTASAKAGGAKTANLTSNTQGNVNKENNSQSHMNVSPELIKQVWSGIKKVLTDYAVHSYSPFSGEWVCDVTHYCEIKSLIAAAHKSISQFERDAEAFCNGATVPEKHGLAGEVDVRALAPLPVEKVVTEIACRIRDEVLCSLLEANNSSSSSNDATSSFINSSSNNNEGDNQEHNNVKTNNMENVETCESNASENISRRTSKQISSKTLTSIPRTLKICIGVGTSPFWAKVACDAEVKAVCKNAMNDTTPVHIRSYHKYTRTAESRKEFVGKLTFGELPIVKPAFAKLLNDVFGIVKCADILRLCEQLQQTFSLETFKYCYAIALGCGELPGEKNAMLVLHNKFMQQNSLLESMASNSISLTNETRTTFGSPANYMTNRFKNRGAKTVNVQNVYGRLISDRQFVQAVAKATTRNITRLHKICKKCSRLRIDFYIDGRNVDHAEVAFRPTADFDTILAHAIRLAKSCADKREHVGKPIKGEIYSIFVALQRLEPIIMIPARCQDEIRELTERYVKWRSHVISYRNQYFKKRKRQSCESRPKRRASEQTTAANVNAVVRNSSHDVPVVARPSALLFSNTFHETKESAIKMLPSS